MEATESAKSETEAKTAAGRNLNWNGGDSVLAVMKEHKVPVAFGVQGGMIMPVYDALARQDYVRHVMSRHEQSAVHEAEGYADSTGGIGCVFATSGPGISNTITGLKDALEDSNRVVVIAGQVPTSKIGTGAFQECDIVGMTNDKKATKWSYQIRTADELPVMLHRAFFLAKSGRPGPVLIDIPNDLLKQKRPYVTAAEALKVLDLRALGRYAPRIDRTAIDHAVTLMRQAKHPVLLIGGGVRSPQAAQALAELVEATGFPVVSTLKGKGAYPSADPHFLGMSGMHGLTPAKQAITHADVLVGIGTRFAERATCNLKGFAPHAKIIHIDIDAQELGRRVPTYVGIRADSATAMRAMTQSWKNSPVPQSASLSDWFGQIEGWRQLNCLKYDHSDQRIEPQYLVERENEYLNGPVDHLKGRPWFMTTDVGDHQMVTAQRLDLTCPRQLMTSGGFGTMGYGLPAAIGVQKANPDALVICNAGDGSLRMSLHELEVAAEERVPVVVSLFDNQKLGMVHLWEDETYDGRHSETAFRTPLDFSKVAKEFGWNASRITDPKKVDEALATAFESREPYLLDFVTTGVGSYPMVPPGGSLGDEPLMGPTPG